MTVKYDFYESPNPSQLNKKKRYHARVVGGYTVTTKQIIKEMRIHGGPSESVIMAALSELKQYMAEHLSEGNSIHLEGIGYFNITLDCPMTSDPSEHHAQSISLKSVKFKPEKGFLLDIDRRISFVRAPYKTKSLALSLDEIKEVLEEHFKNNGFITRKELQQMCGLTRNTATNRLKTLVDIGFLVNKGTARVPIYVLANGDE